MTQGEDEDQTWLDRPPAEDDAERERRRQRREEHRRKVHRRRRRRRLLVITAITASMLLVLGGFWFWWTFHDLERMPSVAGRAGAETPGTTILLVGSNPAAGAASRAGGPGWRHDLAASELVMLLHVTADERSMFVISIPRDSVLDIPGLGPGKLADAATSGGPALVTRTVEEVTGVRLDRLAVMDLNAFREVADVLDGVVVNVPRAVCDLPAGNRRFDGEAALAYIALQPCMPGKDLDRVERQQSLVRALMRGAVDGGKVTNPLAVNRLLHATARNLALEEDFSYPSMLGTLWSMRHLRTTSTTFLTVPVAPRPLASQDGIDYVLLDEGRAAELWAALREDRLAEYVQLTSDAAVLGR